MYISSASTKRGVFGTKELLQKRKSADSMERGEIEL